MTARRLAAWATTTLDPATLGKEHNYTSTYVGSDSLGELLAAHPDISYQVTLPTPSWRFWPRFCLSSSSVAF